ncbi:Membrane protein involved in the export of O-antigen and teichoic acid [Devosia crocina]|uniref:Membrane protein involved in the export of O-antigen and teichoic acid n=1 Tax=Devosia crocina TaxID=429728 RepID=A0A1I7N7H8_9HYPH|nr:polysaccharide biosynthesis C-terminal domain-containing protein [Devosia crocina]SFV30620.1 Membrane protein involved in the export of O-antigen and teichoic acid [Devosia crocina]
MSLARRLASQSFIIFAARIFGAGFIFVAQALIARFWGAGILGEFLLVVASVNLVSVVMPLGYHTVGTYFAAEYRAKGQREQMIAFLLRSYGFVALSFAGLVLVGPLVLDAFGLGQGAVGMHFVPFALLTLGTAIVYVNSAALIGLKRPFAGFFADTLLRPMIVLGAFLLALGSGIADVGFTQMLWMIGVGYVIVSAVQFAFVLQSVPEIAPSSEPEAPQARRWWRFAMPWVVISLATDFFFDIDLLLLSHLLTREELAIFGVCTRMFSLASFGVAAVYAVTMPDIFESEAKADRVTFNRKVGEANVVASLVAILVFTGTVFGAPFALMLFGPEFSAGAVPLAVLCLSLVVRSAAGPASIVLSIHDRPWASLPAIGLGLATLFGCNLLLVPQMGLIGAAIAAVVAISVWSLALWLTALHMAKLDVSILQWFRSRRALFAAE